MQLASPAPEPEKVEQPAGDSYADIMAQKGSKTPETGKVPSAEGTETVNKGDSEVSDLCLKMSSMALPAGSPKPKKSPSSIESIHSPKKAQKSEKKVTIPKTDEKKITTPKTDEKAVPAQKVDEKLVTSPQESVLFAPAEVKGNKMYGGWKGLKGDPEKLERLNRPRAKPLESRWAS